MDVTRCTCKPDCTYQIYTRDCIEGMLDNLVDAARAQESAATAEADARFYRVFARVLDSLTNMANRH